MNDPKANLPQGKQTVLGLYVTAKEAYEKWKAEPDKVKILDVRAPEEFLFVGHPPMAWKIPVAVQSYEWDPVKKKFPMEPLLDFASRVAQVAKPDDTLLAMCRWFVGVLLIMVYLVFAMALYLMPPLDKQPGKGVEAIQQQSK